MADVTTSWFPNSKHSFVFIKEALATVEKTVRLKDAVEEHDLPTDNAGGSETIRMYYANEATADDVKPLSEGQTELESSRTETGTVDVPLNPFYIDRKISSRSRITNPVDYMKIQRQGMGRSLTYWIDRMIRDAVVSGVDSGNKLYAQGVANFSTLQSTAYANAKMILGDIDVVVTKLKDSGALPFENGNYRCYLSPKQGRDIRTDSDFRNMVNNSGIDSALKRKINGYVGTIYGCDVFESHKYFTEPTSGGTEGTYVEGGTLNRALFFGMGAVGVSKMSGNPGAYNPQVAVFDKAEKSDRTNQWNFITMNFWWAAKVLRPTWCATLTSETDPTAT